MTPEAFTYWLAGYFEISNSEELTKSQIKVIKDHINLVLKKTTPNNDTYCDKRDEVLVNAYKSSIDLSSTLLC